MKTKEPRQSAKTCLKLFTCNAWFFQQDNANQVPFFWFRMSMSPNSLSVRNNGSRRTRMDVSWNFLISDEWETPATKDGTNCWQTRKTCDSLFSQTLALCRLFVPHGLTVLGYHVVLFLKQRKYNNKRVILLYINEILRKISSLRLFMHWFELMKLCRVAAFVLRGRHCLCSLGCVTWHALPKWILKKEQKKLDVNEKQMEKKTAWF